MAIIRPVSDLKNYNDVISEVHENCPVYLTKNGRGKCALVDMSLMEEYERLKAGCKLLEEVLSAERESEKNGWYSLEAVEKEAENWK